jgi:hypothetical protein
MSKIYFTINTIDNFEFSELDFELYDEIFGKDKLDFDEFSPESIEDKYSEVEGYPIQIDKLINLLSQFKEKGANYVALHEHCDHIGYNLEAYNIHLSSDEEINGFTFKEKEKERIKKEKEIKKLQTQLDKLKNG